MEIFEDYLGKTASEHESKWKSLKSQGYRFISLSVFGNPNLYAAVLVKRDGPEWEHTRGSLNSLQGQIADYRNKGYAPTIISIAGAANNATYAVVWEKGAFAEGWIVSPFEPDSNKDFFAQCDWARENGYYLVSPTMYGSEINDVKYAAIWARHSNTQPIRWNFHVSDDEKDSKKWTAALPLNRYRISHLAVTTFPIPHRRYLSVFRDDIAGQDIYWWALTPSEDPSLKGREGWCKWIAYNVSEAQYVAFSDDIKKSAFYPICIQGSVIGPNNPPPQYTAIFGRRDRPYDRRWTVTGNDSGTSQYHILKHSSLTGIDEEIKKFMQHDGIRAGVLAIAKKGNHQVTSRIYMGRVGCRISNNLS